MFEFIPAIDIPIYVLYGIGGISIAFISAIVGWYYAYSRSYENDFKIIQNLKHATGFEMPIYEGKQSPGIIASYLRDRKKSKALDTGVIRWHIIDSTFESPKYIKPQRKEGGNIPEIEYENETYLFPEQAAIYSEEEGIPVIIHRRGESNPINLRDPWDDAIDAGTLAQYLTLRVTSTKPSSGFLDGLSGDYDAMTLFRYGLLAIIAFALLMETLGGGLF